MVARHSSPVATPTRRSADASGLIGILNGLAINVDQTARAQASQTNHLDVIPSPSQGSYVASNAAPKPGAGELGFIDTGTTSVPGAGFAYIASNGGYAMHAGAALPLVMNGMYAPSSLGSIIQQPSYPLVGFTSYIAPSPSQFAFDSNLPLVDQINASLHQPYGSEVYYNPQFAGLSNDVGYVNRSYRGGRGDAIMRPRRYNQAAGQHNHVDIRRIKGGSDVRTTVSSSLRVCCK